MMYAEAVLAKRPFVSSDSSLVVEDITKSASQLRGFDDHERIILGRDDERGLTAIIAIHNTTLGRALGGTRIWMHDNFDSAVTDALRLSRGMTFKAAIAGLPLGGGKAVIRANPKSDKTPQLLDAYAEMLAHVQDTYITAEDVGMTLADADYLRERTANVAGTTIGGSGNPSSFTAEGVFLGVKAALKHKTGSDDLTGRRIAIQGLGSVGWSLAEKLSKAGAKLVVADINEARCVEAKEAFGAEIVSTDTILFTEVDVLAPCALGGVLSHKTIPDLKAGIVAGSANNQLLRHEDAAALKERGILYAPDYVINAGGLMNVAAEVEPDGYDKAKVIAKIAQIPTTLGSIFQQAETDNQPTNEIALAMAKARIEKG
ncbi:MAG: Leu/Phe/Val dehydrogenase [Rhizobiaceae bacterium]